MLNNKTIEFNANNTRKLFGVSLGEYFDIENILENSDEYTIIYLEMSNNISGLCIKDKDNKLIAVNSNLSKGRQRYTLAHELCHLLFHDDGCYICSTSIEKDKKNASIEYEADIFASYLLAPSYSFYEKYSQYLEKYNRIIDVAVELEHHFGMSHLSIITRLLLEKNISSNEYDKCFSYSPISISHKLGLSISLYMPTKINKTTGKYIRLANELVEENKISNSKYEQLLLDAYREDMVYGEDTYNEID